MRQAECQNKDPAEVAAPKENIGYIQPTSGQQDTKPSGSDSIGADLDRQQALAEANDPAEREATRQSLDF